MTQENEKNEFLFDATPWVDKGLDLVPIEAFSFDGEVDGLITSLTFINEYEDRPISDMFKELFSISFSENYMTFLIDVNPEDETEAAILLVPMRKLNQAYAEIKELETTGVFKKINPLLVGSLDAVKEITDDMIQGDLSKGSDLFDLLYGISTVQDLNNDAELDTAVFDLLVLLTPIVEKTSTFGEDDLDLDDELKYFSEDISNMEDNVEEIVNNPNFKPVTMYADEFEDLKNKIEFGTEEDLKEALDKIKNITESISKTIEDAEAEEDDDDLK